MRDKPLSSLSVNDLAVAVRQCIFVEQVLPFALQALEIDPLAGDQYDGELIIALKGLPKEYWQNHSDDLANFLRLARFGYEMTLGRGDNGSGDNDLNFGASELLAN